MLESDKRVMNEREKAVPEQGKSNNTDGQGTSASGGGKGGAQGDSEVGGQGIFVRVGSRRHLSGLARISSVLLLACARRAQVCIYSQQRLSFIVAILNDRIFSDDFNISSA